MMSTAMIRAISDDAAYRAAQEGSEPLVPWYSRDLHHAPFLGDYIPAGWRAATWDDIALDKPRGSDWWHGEQAALFVDSSGFGGDGIALDFDDAAAYVARLLDIDSRTYGVGIVQAGQFQVYIGLYVKDETSAGTPVVQPEDWCDECQSSWECYGHDEGDDQ